MVIRGRCYGARGIVGDADERPADSPPRILRNEPDRTCKKWSDPATAGIDGSNTDRRLTGRERAAEGQI